MNSHKIILSLCDHSGNWPRPYKLAGYDVVCYDLKCGFDVRLMELPKSKVYGILAAPPCTMFASSGARWKRTEAEMLEALSVVDACLRLVAICKPKFWALENPIGKLARYLGKPQMYFNPCDFAKLAPEPEEEAYTKRTALWGSFNIPTPVLLGQDTSVHPTLGSKMHLQYGGKSERTKELRSVTPLGFARAFYEVNK